MLKDREKSEIIALGTWEIERRFDIAKLGSAVLRADIMSMATKWRLGDLVPCNIASRGYGLGSNTYKQRKELVA